MSFFVYFIVLLITVGSVIFGADWLQAPMTPMAPSKYELQAAKPPPPPAVKQAETTTPDVKADETTGVQAQASAQTSVNVPVATAAPAPVAMPQPVPIIADPQPAAVEPPKCDIAACERAYRSFTASDCTYQPSDGPRRLCTKGTPPAAASVVKPDGRATASCNIAACTDAYISFNSSDCTYQPSEGPRRLCTK